MPQDGSKLNSQCGSAGYTAPELLSNLGYDTQIDVYSLGSIVYEMMSGCALFGGDNKYQVLA